MLLAIACLLLGLVLAVFACIRANRAIAAIVERVNEGVDPAARETSLGWTWGTWTRVAGRYRALEPGGRLIGRYRLWVALTMCGLVGSCTALGAFAG